VTESNNSRIATSASKLGFVTSRNESHTREWQKSIVAFHDEIRTYLFFPSVRRLYER
jgi:hypothetical protein